MAHLEPEDRYKTDSLWQIFNIGLGFFMIGVLVHIFAPILLPGPIPSETMLRASANFQTAVLLANWFLGVGSGVIGIACVFLCLRSLKS